MGGPRRKKLKWEVPVFWVQAKTWIERAKYWLEISNFTKCGNIKGAEAKWQDKQSSALFTALCLLKEADVFLKLKSL